MPVEIRELVIRAVVAPAADDDEPPPSRIDEARLVQRCVDEVLKALRRRQER